MARPHWQADAQDWLFSAHISLRTEGVVRAIEHAHQARLISGECSGAGHLWRGRCALLLAEAWAYAANYPVARRELDNARDESDALLRDTLGTTHRESVDREARHVKHHAALLEAYLDECARRPDLSLDRARAVAKDPTAEPEVVVLAVARWIAGALKGGKRAEAVAAERHLDRALGEQDIASVSGEAWAVLARWKAVRRVQDGDLDEADALLYENVAHHETCRRCAVLDQFVVVHIAAARGGEENRALAREMLAGVRENAEHGLGVLSPLFFFEERVLPNLDL